MLSFTAKERETRKFEQYQKLRNEFCGLSREKQQFRYVSIKAKLRHQNKIVYPIILIFWFFIVFGLLKSYLGFVVDAMEYLYVLENPQDIELEKIVLIILTILLVLTLILCIWLMIEKLRALSQLQMKYELYESLMKQDIKDACKGDSQ